MSRKTRKRGRRRLLVIVVLLALIVFGVFARGLLTSGRTTAERAARAGYLCREKRRLA